MENPVAAKCNETFNPEEDLCQTCKDNFSCFEKLILTFPDCNVKDGTDDSCGKNSVDYCGKNSVHDCGNRDLYLFCRRLKPFYKTRKDFCANFGTPKLNPIEKCLDCKTTPFESCDRFDLFFKNIRLQSGEIDTMIENQLFELRTEEGKCFEKFAFEETCWEECDYKLRCLKGSEIFPSVLCTNFPKNATTPFGEITDATVFNDGCRNCKFFPSCTDLYKDKIEYLNEECKKKKMFQNFFSIGEIRNQFVEED